VEFYIGLFDNGSSYTAGELSSPSPPYTSDDIDITGGVIRHHPNDGLNALENNRILGFNDVEVILNKTSGDALVSFDSGAPADIDSYDLATFQRTLDGEAVTVDIEDGNGNVLFSDISPDFDISTIDTSKNVKLRANLSRADTANNPTLDFAARRFTR